MDKNIADYVLLIGERYFEDFFHSFRNRKVIDLAAARFYSTHLILVRAIHNAEYPDDPARDDESNELKLNVRNRILAVRDKFRTFLGTREWELFVVYITEAELFTEAAIDLGAKLVDDANTAYIPIGDLDEDLIRFLYQFQAQDKGAILMQNAIQNAQIAFMWGYYASKMTSAAQAQQAPQPEPGVKAAAVS